MTIAENIITEFHSQPVSFFTNMDGERAVSVCSPHTGLYTNHNVKALAKEILAHKRAANRRRQIMAAA